jgi:hypothetical protein
MTHRRPSLSPRPGRLAGQALALAGALALGGCAASSAGTGPELPSAAPPAASLRPLQIDAPRPDPREGLEAGLFDAEEAAWNMQVISRTPPEEPFVGQTNSDLAFKGNYVFQGNYDGVQIWDISDPTAPRSVVTYVCPASQSDVSVYGDLLFVSGEGLGGRLDCGPGGVDAAVSEERLRGIRIFDISDVENPAYVANVQTCRGSHTHTVLKDPDDDENVYIYVSGSAPVRPAEELPGCVSALPSDDPESALFRIEVIQVPLDDPESAAIVSSPRIFEDLVAPPTHGPAPADLEAIEEARARGAFILELESRSIVLPDRYVQPALEQFMEQRGGTEVTAADSAAFRAYLPQMAQQMGGGPEMEGMGPTQCHDITVYPAVGLAGGACEGYGLLLDIEDPVNPRRLDAVADSNFSYWHSATFDNAGTKLLFSDEWGGGSAPKCRESDPMEWGADAIFTIEEGDQMEFQSYFKIPAAQTSEENCVAHNGSLIPVPGRDVMVQSWYQGGLSVFDWSDPANPVEIAFHDRGPVSAERLENGGAWSAYWYDGHIVSSEIARGLDVLVLTPSEALSENEIEAARSVRLELLNSQGQPQFEWPHTFALARAYVDQLERSRAVSQGWIDGVRTTLREAEAASGAERRRMLEQLAGAVRGDAPESLDPDRMILLADAVEGLAGA